MVASQRKIPHWIRDLGCAILHSFCIFYYDVSPASIDYMHILKKKQQISNTSKTQILTQQKKCYHVILTQSIAVFNMCVSFVIIISVFFRPLTLWQRDQRIHCCPWPRDWRIVSLVRQAIAFLYCNKVLSKWNHGCDLLRLLPRKIGLGYIKAVTFDESRPPKSWTDKNFDFPHKTQIYYFLTLENVLTYQTQIYFSHSQKITSKFVLVQKNDWTKTGQLKFQKY